MSSHAAGGAAPGYRLRPIDLAIGILGGALALVVALGMPYDPLAVSLGQGFVPPGWAHPFGTDHLGRDVLARVAHAFFIDLGLAVAITVAGVSLGIGIGLVAGYAGPVADGGAVIAMDLVSALPQLVVAIVLSVYLGDGSLSLVTALVLTGWVKFARVMRAEVLALREADFVTGLRVLGASRGRILFLHLLPNAVPAMSGLIAVQFGHVVLNIAALGFLGIGVQPPTPEWGAMIAEARGYLFRAPWMALFPGLVLFAFSGLILLLAERLMARGTEETLTGEARRG